MAGAMRQPRPSSRATRAHRCSLVSSRRSSWLAAASLAAVPLSKLMRPRAAAWLAPAGGASPRARQSLLRNGCGLASPRRASSTWESLSGRPAHRSGSARMQASQSQVGPPGTERNRDLLVFLVSQFVLFIAIGALVPVLPLYGNKFGLTQSSVGLLVSSPSAAKLALNFPMGRLADSVGRLPLMVAGMFVCAVADVGTGLAVTLPFLIASRLLLGVGVSTSDAGATAWVADATQDRPERRASFLGLQNAVLAAAFVLGPTVGGSIVDTYGMSSIFFTVAAGATACALGYATLPELWTPSEKRDESASFQELLASREQQALAGVSVAFYTGTACKISLIPSVAAEVFSYTPTEVGQLFSALAAIGIVGTLLGGRLADSLGPRTVLVACGVICSLGYFGAAYAVFMGGAELFLASLGLWALAASVKSPALQAFAIAASPEDKRGAALSVPKTVGDLSYAIAPFLLGAADDQLGPTVALAGCAATFAAGTAFFGSRAS